MRSTFTVEREHALLMDGRKEAIRKLYASACGDKHICSTLQAHAHTDTRSLSLSLRSLSLPAQTSCETRAGVQGAVSASGRLPHTYSQSHTYALRAHAHARTHTPLLGRLHASPTTSSITVPTPRAWQVHPASRGTPGVVRAGGPSRASRHASCSSASGWAVPKPGLQSCARHRRAAV